MLSFDRAEISLISLVLMSNAQAATMTFAPKYYLQRAIELEAMANQVSEPAGRAGYLDLARSFRAMAEVATGSQKPGDTEVQLLAERMIGKASGPH
jgi:hypothetical protein